MTVALPEPVAPAVQVDPAIALLALRAAIFIERQRDAERRQQKMRAGAESAFAQIRNAALRGVEVRIPDGPKVGLISIKDGYTSWTIDDQMLTAIIAGNKPADIEEYVEDRAFRDPKVLALITERFPEYVKRRPRPDVRDRYIKDAQKRSGQVRDELFGEYVKVATSTPHPSTGEFSYRADDKDGTPLLDAISAGVINEWGEPAQPALTRAEQTETADEASVDGPPEPGPAVTCNVCRRPECKACYPSPSRAAPVPVIDEETAQTRDLYAWVQGKPGDTQQAAAQDLAEPEPLRPTTRTAKPVLTPTGEQQKIIAAWTETGDNLTIRAVAGSGKTSTQVMLAEATKAAGFYVAYNKSVAQEARRKFPSHVTCKTAHALAFAAVGTDYAHRFDGPRVTARTVAKILRINQPSRLDSLTMLAPEQIARLALETNDGFMHSADPEPGPQHVPWKPGFSNAAMEVLRRLLPPLAAKAWADLCLKEKGELRYSPDCYLKLWQLGDPVIEADYVLLDEAQDSDRVLIDVLTRQKNTRLIAVGDGNQQIYQWRGAVNAMDAFSGIPFTLTESFRFGPAIAAEANKWLTILGADVQVTGNKRKTSMICDIEWPDAVLCRTNGGALGQVIAATEAGRKPALVGGGAAIKKMAEAAERLQDGRPAYHPELIAFSTWGQVQDYVENDHGGSDLAVMVRLIDAHGAAEIIRIVESLASESRCDVAISTAHKAKGLEWHSVRIANDFPAPRGRQGIDGEPEVRPADARLAYVAITRAMNGLDRSGLAWVDRFAPIGVAA
jgi:hypothetical protein